ncbi:paralemmin 1a isoform X2 [Amphiprion ocellaris]|uniref:paralemmin 1a isoform X2 n=1 Tax=Amphiprion ocellaris TaxID=80972 RepID=UPI002410C96E|nr:paralemmin 1a isoform X2 [Amphiprion ocellaris]
MEINEVVCQQDRLQLIAERRKWQTEVENKKRQLEDDRRALQHLKSKALRERWLLDGAPAAGPEHEEVKRQLEQDEAKTRSLEETINRLEQELVNLETGVMCETITHTSVSSGKPAVEVKGHSVHQQDRAAPPVQVTQEVKVHKSPRMNKARNSTEEMKRAMYSLEITVERDKLTGETRVLSSQTRLPVDLSLQGVKVYEDEQKVVHEMNGEDVHLLSSSEVEELIHKADEASMMSQTVTTATSLPTAEVQQQPSPEPPPPMQPRVTAEITGLEAKPESEPSVAEASAENPVTMVFMGYQSVEDEDETKKVLGLQGTVKAELVLIDDADGKTSPGREEEEEVDMARPIAQTPPTTKAPTTTKAPPTAPPTSPKPPEATASNGETAAEAGGGAAAAKKEKQPWRPCCSETWLQL